MQDLNSKITTLRNAINPMLPDGCPFILGGGLIRDAMYGGRPGDIDVWLPSNINVPDIDEFQRQFATRSGLTEGWTYRPLFTGPGAHVSRELEGIGFNTIEQFGTEDYRDVSNRWVIEIEHNDWPRINFMRTMHDWAGDAPSFFTSLMRNFDLDCCMFFIGMMPGQNNIDTLILPEHMTSPNRSTATFLNEVYWNQLRLETTSRERVLARINKMNEKYYFRIPTNNPSVIRMIRTEDIRATVMRFRDIMPHFNSRSGFGNAAMTTPQNRMTQAQLDVALENARVAYEEYRERYGVEFMTAQRYTVRSFLRYGS